MHTYGMTRHHNDQRVDNKKDHKITNQVQVA